MKDPRINETVLGFVKAYFNFKSDYSVIEDKVKTILSSKGSSQDKWNSMRAELSTFDAKSKQTSKYTKAELCLMEMKLNFLYPRLDINVSKHINHLLKSPFCVHPKTGLISVPMSESDIIDFDINKIPSLVETIEDFMEGNK